MYYGVKCDNGEGYHYSVIHGDSAEQLFENDCEAVFNDEDNAIVYANWLSD